MATPSIEIKPATTILSRYLPFHPSFPLQTLEILAPLPFANTQTRRFALWVPNPNLSFLSYSRSANIDRFHALTGIKFTSLPRICRACTARGCPRPRPFFRLRGGALGRDFYTGGISSEFAPRSAVYENRERGEGVAQSGRYQSEPSAAVGAPRNRANKFPSRGLRGSLSNNRLFCRPRHVPLWDLLWKRFTNIISTATTPSISESGSPCGFPPPPAPGSRRR